MSVNEKSGQEAGSPSRLLVSVIIPAFNSALFLPDALRSVLNQTYPHLEVVVVDDGSVDSTAELLAEWAAQDKRVRWVRQENQGLPSARNTGMRQASGELLAFLDADDVIMPEKLERQVAFLNAHPEVDLVYSDYCTSDPQLRILTHESVARRIPLAEAYKYTNVFPVMSPLLRRCLAERVGEFDPALKACEDWDYWIRCQRAGVFAYLPGHWSVYRMHGSQMHKNLDFMLHYARMAASKHFQNDPEAYSTYVGSIIYWQFGLQMQDENLNRWTVLLRPRVLAKVWRLVREVRSVRRALHIRHVFRTGV